MQCTNCGAALNPTDSVSECAYCGTLHQIAPVVLAHSLRIETINQTATVIVPKWRALPTGLIQAFSTGMDNQQAVSVHLLQGERETVIQNREVGLFVFDGIPPAPRAVPSIQFRFEIDEAGILLVTAENQSTGKKVTFPRMQLEVLKKKD